MTHLNKSERFLDKEGRPYLGTTLCPMQRIHFVGIGGVGMGGIAEVLLNQGFLVSGSDLGTNLLTRRLQKLGAQVYVGHQAHQVDRVDVVVVSSAIDEHNVEVQAAKAQGLPIVPRAEMLAELMRFRYGIAVAGTHGKTTTTSLLASLLGEAGLDPTFVIGGQLNGIGANAQIGKGHYFVAEADESDGSFLHLNPMVSIVTNIDRDHLLTYGGDFDQLKKTFVEFLHNLPFYGCAVLCADCPVIQEIVPKISRRRITFGLSSKADIQARNIHQTGTMTRFEVYRGDKPPLPVVLNLPGHHNVLNALAAIAVASEMGVKDEFILSSLRKFQGIGRRFQMYGDKWIQDKHVTWVDDYGHHPKEIKATLQAARKAWPDQRLVLVFQPHRFSRTFDLFEDFVAVLSEVDVLILLEVYSAGEAFIPGADSRSLCRAIRQRKGPEPIFIEQSSELMPVLEETARSQDIILTQGAGDIGALSAKLAHALQNVE